MLPKNSMPFCRKMLFLALKKTQQNNMHACSENSSAESKRDTARGNDSVEHTEQWTPDTEGHIVGTWRQSPADSQPESRGLHRN